MQNRPEVTAWYRREERVQGMGYRWLLVERALCGFPYCINSFPIDCLMPLSTIRKFSLMLFALRYSYIAVNCHIPYSRPTNSQLIPPSHPPSTYLPTAISDCPHADMRTLVRSRITCLVGGTYKRQSIPESPNPSPSPSSAPGNTMLHPLSRRRLQRCYSMTLFLSRGRRSSGCSVRSEIGRSATKGGTSMVVKN